MASIFRRRVSRKNYEKRSFLIALRLIALHWGRAARRAPMALTVKWNDRQVARRQRSQRDRGVASGGDGVYLKTTDGGATWRAATVPGAEALDFRDVEAFDSDTAYLLSIGEGERSRIYKTTDGGGHWRLQFTNRNPKAFFDALAFWDADRGVAVSDSVDGRFVIIRTTDGGESWKELPPEKLPPEIA